MGETDLFPRLASDLSHSLAVEGEAVEDLVGALVPDVGFGVLVSVGDPGPDRSPRSRTERWERALDPLLAHLGEPALDQVQPGAEGVLTSRGVVQASTARSAWSLSAWIWDSHRGSGGAQHDSATQGQGWALLGDGPIAPA